MKCYQVESKSITDTQALQRPLPSSHVIPFVKKIAQTVPHLNGENPIDLNHQKQRGSSTEHHLLGKNSYCVKCVCLRILTWSRQRHRPGRSAGVNCP